MTNTLPTGFYPFWFWNDRLSADEIRWQVVALRQSSVLGCCSWRLGALIRIRPNGLRHSEDRVVECFGPS